ncbi:predicted protein [Naegleria gruberi]|uniref:Predicted protein n=1 Tax=Naegleria gruberi TaxID=5762 RepID=D2W289_NAEGR|nr:uncharacterized protein NAEGRDRAFT_75501 [Naegleria gruberi]EFC36783.1 predicted protein [Naegleria gruberi]|eukprot:XP_002669527.1 predicted protein [Naegleria gruberi strain NEG-M]
MITGTILARSGKTRLYYTPKTQSPKRDLNTFTPYNGGCSKHRKKSSTNQEYSSGGERFDSNFSELNENSKCKNHDMCAEPVLINSSSKFNTVKGLNKLEWCRAKHEENYKIRVDKRNTRNHKKWYRNHPEGGFCQKRMIMDLHNTVE